VAAGPGKAIGAEVMARARNVKPGLYKNEDLADCSIWARYIFPGLWMLADREGRMEDRPKRIKGELLPHDNVDINPLLDELVQFGFILRYQIDGIRYIQVIKFSDHQTPHVREQASTIPAPPVLLEDTAKAVLSTILDGDESSPRSPDVLIPDSLSTDSLIADKAPKKNGALAEPKYSALDDLIAQGVDKQIAVDWLALRKGKRAAPTKTAIDGVLREIGKAGLTIDAGLRICCERGWVGFNPSWLKPQSTGSPQASSRHSGFEKIDYQEGIEDGRIT
jgi:hypothetical protein